MLFLQPMHLMLAPANGDGDPLLLMVTRVVAKLRSLRFDLRPNGVFRLGVKHLTKGTEYLFRASGGLGVHEEDRFVGCGSVEE